MFRRCMPFSNAGLRAAESGRFPLNFCFSPRPAVLEFPPIRDIAPPVEPEAAATMPLIWWVAASVLAGLLLVGLFLWMRSVGRRLTLPGLPPQPEKLAVRALESLRQAAPKLGAEAFAAQLSEILRTFLHRQTGVLARFATSPEILGDRPRADQPPPPPVIAAFREVLTASDALKYGQGSADRTVKTDALIDSALVAVRAAAAPPPPISPPTLPCMNEVPPLPAAAAAADSRN